MKRDGAYRRMKEENKKEWAKRTFKRRKSSPWNNPEWVKFRITKPKTEEEYKREEKRKIGRRANTPQLCSCASCGNPRHSSWNNEDARKTMQERKEDRADIDNEIYTNSEYYS